MLALPPTAAAGKLWFERLPARTRQIVVIVATGIVAIVLLFTIRTWYHRSQPIYVLEVLDDIHFPAEVERNNDYFTPEGKAVWLWMMSNSTHSAPNGQKLILSAPEINGDVCEFSGRYGEGSFKIKLVKASRWQFSDFYFDTWEGKKIGLWASYIKDHPYLTQWKLHWRDLIDACLDGVMLGMKML